MTGRSAYERDLRQRLEQLTDIKDKAGLMVPLGVLRGVLHDLDLWHELVENEIDKWSFDALIAMAKRLLDEVYPETIFPMPKTEALVGQLSERDSGPMFVSVLRKVIAHIEKTPPPTPRPPKTLAMQVVELLPDDRVLGLAVLDDARRMVERFKR